MDDELRSHRLRDHARRLSDAMHLPHAAPRSSPEPQVAPEEPAWDSAEASIGDCAAYGPDGRDSGRLSIEEAVSTTADDDNRFVWVGMRQPTAEQFQTVAERFSLPPLAVEDAIGAHQRPKLEVYGDVVFAVLKPVRYVDSEEVVDVSEIAIFVGPGYVVTVRHGESNALATVRKEFDAGCDHLKMGPASVLYRAADVIVDAYEVVAAQIAVDVDEIEAQVFSGDGHDHAQRVYKLKREVLEFRRAVVPLGIPLHKLSEGLVPGIPDSASTYFRDVHDHLMRAADGIEAHDRMLTDVLSADLAQASVRQNDTAVRQNEDMRKISAWAAIALVPTAIAGIYGMNFTHMLGLTWRYGFYLTLAGTLGICAVLYRSFRRNGWL